MPKRKEKYVAEALNSLRDANLNLHSAASSGEADQVRQLINNYFLEPATDSDEDDGSDTSDVVDLDAVQDTGTIIGNY